MILLLIQQNDTTSINIIDWLIAFNKKFIILNNVNYIVDISFRIHDKCEVTLKDGTIFLLSDIKSAFIRRGQFYFEDEFYNNEADPITELEKRINKFTKSEISELKEYMNAEICNLANRIGEFNEGNINKLNALHKAKQFGLKIPKTIITTKKSDLEFDSKLITKAISNGFIHNEHEHSYSLKTQVVREKDLTNNFGPSLFQTCLDKLVELRVFYVLGEFYSMAIFSQEDEKTSIDFRNYDYKNPTNVCPYQLPEHIEYKLNKLMKVLNLTTGSIDLILTESNEYIFLEVNPTGQFGMVSEPCNYNIEKKIAELL
ncbi:grasp-with-spasm system ATP-grasp peptide maturase [Flavobacteriales bacterium]|nr:grasp-with-spasm system ATP-grasp peptide maturase [Flavobacteriales bacterium]